MVVGPKNWKVPVPLPGPLAFANLPHPPKVKPFPETEPAPVVALMHSVRTLSRPSLLCLVIEFRYPNPIGARSGAGNLVFPTSPKQTFATITFPYAREMSP